MKDLKEETVPMRQGNTFGTLELTSLTVMRPGRPGLEVQHTLQ